MAPIDKRGRLSTDPFDYRERKDGHIEILRGGRVVLVVSGPASAKLSQKLARATEPAIQLLLAKASGHYKH